MKLTNTTVRDILPPEKGYIIQWDDVLSGFGVRVTASGYKSFIAEARVKINGQNKTRRVTIAKFGVKTADEARKEAKKELGKMAGNIDPSAENSRQKAENITLEEIAEDYKKNKRRKGDGLPLKDSTKADIDKHLNSTFKDWKKKPVSTITREQVKKLYLNHCKRSVAQANQAMRILQALINYARAITTRTDGTLVIIDNPVWVLRGDANILRRVKPRSNKVPTDDVGKWWSAVQAMRNNPALTISSRSAADLVALLALTGLRIGEASAIRYEQLDLDEGSLVLRDTKNRTEKLTLPLSKLAVEIIKNRTDSSEWLFPARSGSGHLKDCRGQLDTLAEKTEIRITAHDLRRTFSAVARECKIELWRTKALMGHKINKQDVTLTHYTDLEDVRDLRPEADAIAKYYESKRLEFEGDNVVNIRERTA